MSTAHRPTWTPAQAKATSTSSRQFSSRDMAAQTKLKFRQPGQGTQNEVSRRDLRLELERAEKRGKNGKGTMEEAESLQDEEANQAAKRRKLLVEAAALDRDDSDDETAGPAKNGDKAAATESGAGATTAAGSQAGDSDEGENQDDEDDSDSDDDSEDETADLLRELEKIKRERAEEKERQERETAASSEADREAAVAMGNPLLNLQAAMAGNATPGGASTASGGSFGVKRRWDDDVIFKNQANDEKPRKEFVNDLLRTEFHKKFLKRFIA